MYSDDRVDFFDFPAPMMLSGDVTPGSDVTEGAEGEGLGSVKKGNCEKSAE